MSTTTTDQRMRVAHHIMNTGDEMGKSQTIKTSDDQLARMIALSLSMAIHCDTPEDITEFVDSLISAHEVSPPAIKYWTFMCLITKWLSWAWHAEEQDDLSKAWADGWDKVNDYSLSHLKGDDLSYYIRETD